MPLHAIIILISLAYSSAFSLFPASPASCGMAKYGHGFSTTCPLSAFPTRATRPPQYQPKMSILDEGDTVMVVGATGRIGQLVSQKLLVTSQPPLEACALPSPPHHAPRPSQASNRFKVRLLGNNARRAEELGRRGAEAVLISSLRQASSDVVMDIRRRPAGTSSCKCFHLVVSSEAAATEQGVKQLLPPPEALGGGGDYWGL